VSGDAFEPRTAISILLDDAAPEVAAARYELDPGARLRVPLHVTLLFPFVPRREASSEVVAGLRDFFGQRPRPVFDLAHVDAFPDVVAYAAPEPAGDLATLIRQLSARYPETPPYGGAFAEPVPHATLAPLGAAGLEAVRARVRPLLPVRCEPRHASLIEEFEPDRWRELEPLPFADGSAR
jgi:2'-5' RNA ligase